MLVLLHGLLRESIGKTVGQGLCRFCLFALFSASSMGPGRKCSVNGG